MASLRGHRPLILLSVVFIALASFYNVVNPIFEAPDELWHFQFVKHLADGRGLPVLQEDPAENVAGQEGGQPPLYHVLAALAISRADTSDFARFSVPSPFLQRIGEGPNVVMHTASEDLPYRGTVLAVHLVRFLSTLMGAGTVLLTYLLSLEVFRGSRHLALGAAAVTALIPEFLFTSASINNDNLIILLSGLALFLSVRGVNRGLQTGGILGLGATLAAAPLTKVSGVALAVLAVGALVLRAWRVGSVSPLRPVLLFAPMVAVTAGWWFLRNWTVYGDPLGLRIFIKAAGGSTPLMTPGRLWAEAHGIWVSTWALFGWSNIEADFGIYAFYGAVCLVSAVGLLKLAHDRNSEDEIWSRPAAAVLVLWTLTFLALVAQYMRMISGMQGRLFFPALPAIAVLLIAGMSKVIPRRWDGSWTRALGVVFLIPAVLAPIAYIVPAYPRVALLEENQIAAIRNRIDATYGESIALLGYDVTSSKLTPGQPLQVTLYWQALAIPARNYTVFIHVIDAWNNVVGGFDGPLGGKAYPTAAWRSGVVLQENYAISLADPKERPSSLRIEVGLYALPSVVRLPAFDARGQAIGDAVSAARVKAIKPPVHLPPAGREAAFDQALALAGYSLELPSLLPGKSLEGRLWWKANAVPDRDYTVFVQLVGPAGLVAQYDSQPRRNSYPTSLWDTGEVVEDFFTLSVPQHLEPGPYRVIAGLYDGATGKRLNSGGGDHVVLSEVSVAP